MLGPLPPDDLPVVTVTVEALAEAKRAGYLRIHDNGILTVHIPGRPVVQVVTPKSQRTRTPRNDTEREHLPNLGSKVPKMRPNGNTPAKARREAYERRLALAAQRQGLAEPPQG